MKTFYSSEEVADAGLPTGQGTAMEETMRALAEAVSALEKVFGKGYPRERGCVVFVEAEDRPEAATKIVGQPFDAVLLEGAYRRHGCLVGVTIMGNSGDGITWVCPDREGYAPEIRELLRQVLWEPTKG